MINNIITNQKMLFIDELELKSDLKDNTDDLIHIVICTIKNEQNYYYELKQQFEYKNIAEDLIEKIYIKGIINPEYWYCKDIKDYNSYYSDIESAMQECDDSNYYNDINEDDDPRVVDDQIYLSDGVWINKEDAWF